MTIREKIERTQFFHKKLSLSGALAGNAIYGRVQQILTVSFNIKVKEMEIRELRHFAKCLPRKKCCTVLSGRVIYDPSFIHAFKLKCLELWEGRLILPTGRNTCQEQGRHILICFPMEEPPARRLNWWKVQPSRNWNNEIISKSNHPHTPMSIGRIPHFDRGIASFCMGQNPEWSGLSPKVYRGFPIELVEKEMSGG